MVGVLVDVLLATVVLVVDFDARIEASLSFRVGGMTFLVVKVSLERRVASRKLYPSSCSFSR
jgi:hypothetical protein